MLNKAVSTELRKYARDWVVVFGIFLVLALVEATLRPFNRKFSITDEGLKHPFTEHERVNNFLCGVYAVFVPLVTMAAVTKYKFMRAQAETLSSEDWRLSKDWAHLVNVTFLAFSFCVLTTLFVTDLLKNWISRPRPDFIARCVPRIPSPEHVVDGVSNSYYDLDVCTAPMGEAVLLEGLRSCPSGHSSLAFAGLNFLTLWLMGQAQVFRKTAPLYLWVAVVVPELLAAYVAVSRSMDYRHHTTDILFGTSLGLAVSTTVYCKYFPTPTDTRSCTQPYDDEADALPV